MGDLDIDIRDDDLLAEGAEEVPKTLPKSLRDRLDTGKGEAADRADPDDDTVQKSVEGYIIIVTGVHEEASEEQIHDTFAEYGEIANIHLNLDRQTGEVKGYALLEYKNKVSASDAVEKMNGEPFLGKTIVVDWAFKRPPKGMRRFDRSRLGGRDASPPRS